MQTIMPHVQVSIYDPVIFPLSRRCVADAAIIASPAHCHKDDVRWCIEHNMPFFVEKPLGVFVSLTACDPRSAVGFHYRFHKQWHDIVTLAYEQSSLHFYVREQLFTRYGATAKETSTSHSIDIACTILGVACFDKVSLSTDGIRVYGTITHSNGISIYDYDINTFPKNVWIGNATRKIVLERDDSCYQQEMEAWMRCLDGKERDARLATIADGVTVEYILSRVTHGIMAT